MAKTKEIIEEIITEEVKEEVTIEEKVEETITEEVKEEIVIEEVKEEIIIEEFTRWFATQEEELEYHLARCEGNFLVKDQVRAIFNSLFRA